MADYSDNFSGDYLNAIKIADSLARTETTLKYINESINDIKQTVGSLEQSVKNINEDKIRNLQREVDALRLAMSEKINNVDKTSSVQFAKIAGIGVIGGIIGTALLSFALSFIKTSSAIILLPNLIF